MYLVNKTFGEAGITRVNGEIVDGKNYKLLSKLVNLRYLTVLDRNIEPVKCQLCDRQFADTLTLETHYIMIHPDQIEVT